MPSLRGPNNSVVRMATRRVPNIPRNESWKQTQSDAMLSVAQLARDGKIHLFTYNELEIENLNGTFFPVSLAADCLAGVKINRVPAAIERSKFQQMPLKEFAEKGTRIEFCRWLLSLDYREVVKRPAFRSMFSDVELRNLESLNRFKEICAGLSELHYPDALHLWTAEVNDLDFFLTTDKKFFRAITETTRIVKTTQPIFPSDFLARTKRNYQSI
jgi:hypothetical protein